MSAEQKAWAEFDKQLAKTSKVCRRLIRRGKISLNNTNGKPGITRIAPEEQN